VIHDYVDTGKVYLIHHDFPLPTFKYSREAALYAIAASRFNKYEQVGDALFARQEYWGANGKVEEVVASVLTPDEMKKARVLIKDPQVNQQLDHEIELGHAAKVNSTPSIFLTKRLRVIPVPPNVSYPILHKVIDDLLK
jgi:protein-disulfide isomerase